MTRTMSRFGGSRQSGSRWSLWLVALGATIIFVWPIVMIVIGAFRTGLPGTPNEWTIDRALDVFRNGRTYSTMWSSAVYAVLVTVCSISLGIYFAWVTTRTDAPLRRFVSPLMLIIMATPALFFAIGWDMLGNARVGTLNNWIRALIGSDQREGPININSWWGLTLVTSLKACGLAYFLIVGPFASMNRSYEEAAIVSGASRFKTFVRIQIPLLAPAILGTAMLSFVFVLEAFDIPQVLGTPAGIRVFSTEIFSYLNATQGGNFAGASTLSTLLVVIVLGLVYFQRRILGRRQFTTVSGKSFRSDAWELGRAKWVVTATIVVFAIVAVALPMWQIYSGSLRPFFGLNNEWTTIHYRELWADPDFRGALRNTIVISSVGGLLAILIATWIAWLVRSRPGPITRYIAATHWLTVAVPGLVLGLGMLWAFLSTPFLRSLYGSAWILFVALVVSAIPIAMRSAEGAVAQVPLDLQEAAVASGASRAKAFRSVIVPIVRRSVFNGWAIAAVLISGNLAVPVLLASPRASVVATEVLRAYRNGDYARAAAIFGILLIVWLIAAVIIAVIVAIVRLVRLQTRSTPPAVAPAPA